MNGADLVTLYEGPEALSLSVTCESLIMAVVAPLAGAGVEVVALRRALRRVVDSDEAWAALVASMRHAESVATLARADVAELRERQKGEPS